MKKISLSLLLISVIFISNAQIRVLSNGRIGLGTVSPISRLDVRQDNGRITANGLYFFGSALSPDGLPYSRLIENWGMRYASPDNRWAFSTSNSILIGHVPTGQDWVVVICG